MLRIEVEGDDAAFMDVHLNRRVKAEVLTKVFDQTVWRKAAEKVGLRHDSVLGAPIIGVAYAAAQVDHGRVGDRRLGRGIPRLRRDRGGGRRDRDGRPDLETKRRRFVGHNGAWPTLRDMLDSPDKRPRKFVVRPSSFDPTRVGLDTSPAKSSEKLFVFDASIKGNHNGGHLYGTDLDESQKDDLVEYLKSL